MVSNQLKLENVEAKVKSLYKNEGQFETEDGRRIDFENYTGVLEIEGCKVKMKIDKGFNEIMRELVDENNLLDI